MARASKNGKASVAVILIRVNKYNLWVPPEAKLFFVHGLKKQKMQTLYLSCK